MLAHPNGSEFYIYLIDSSGIHPPIHQSIGHSYVIPGLGRGGEMVFSPDGSKLAAVSQGMIDYFDFDRCTGTLSNYLDLSVGLSAVLSEFYGVSFSSENSFLYASTSSTLNT